MGGGPAALAPTPVAAHDTSALFVTRSGSQLMLDGQPYRFTGINMYNANSDGWCAEALTDAQYGQALDDIGLGTDEHGVIRAWFFQTLAAVKGTGARDWSRFDRTLQIARDRGYKVIATLTDQWGECGTNVPPTYSFKSVAWYTGGYAAPDPGMLAGYGAWLSYRDWVAEVVDRYKDEPAILAWQLINEAEVNPGGAFGVCPPGDGPRDVLLSWATNVSNLVRSIDANHLISLGTIGGGQCGTSGPQYQDVHALPNIDVCEYHDYTPNQAIPGDQWNGLSVRVQQCAALDKPLIVGETGIRPDDAGGTYGLRAVALRAKLVAQAALGIDGVITWNWVGAGSSLTDYNIGPGDPILDELQTPGSTLVVTTTDDVADGICDATHCSLREALTASNATPCLDLVAFAIAGPAPHTIAPTAALTVITDAVVIDGTTQPDFAGSPVVELRGLSAPFGDGLRIEAGGSAVRGLVVNGFGDTSIHLVGGGGSLITGNRIGTNVAGTAGAPRPPDVANSGIQITDSPANRIGGITGGDGNLISGSAVGVYVEGTTSTGNQITRNRIGTNPDGNAAVPNWNVGVLISQGSANQVGGGVVRGVGQGNVISGNQTGVAIYGTNVGSNFVQGNIVGLAANGDSLLPNAIGIWIALGGHTKVGGTSPGSGNVISGNGVGIQVDGPDAFEPEIVGNRIGTNANGTSSRGNGVGISVSSVNGGWIGGPYPGSGNLISGNTGSGIELGLDSQAWKISANRIGTDVSGLLDLGNAVGIQVSTGSSLLSTESNLIGEGGLGNVISGNDVAGVRFSEASRPATFLTYNTIGLGADGSTVIPNGVGVSAGAGTSSVWINDVDPSAQNVIAGNLGPGVLVTDGTIRVVVGANEIRDNGGLGVDLGGDGVSANDVLDADGGNNHGQNFPELLGAVAEVGATTIDGTLDSVADTLHFVLLYANTACDPSGHGEGATYLGSTEVTTDGVGHAAFSAIVGESPVGSSITALTLAVIAIEGSDNLGFHVDSSEFSACITATGSAATPTGPTEVVIPGPSGDLTLAFDSVDVAGVTTVDTSTAPPPLPAGFQFGDPPHFYNITTTAAFSGFIEVCVTYDEASFAEETGARLLHYNAALSSWGDVTSSLDTNLNILCGLTDSLSPFAVTERAYVFEGFASPVDEMPTINRAKAGGAIPVKFSLAGGDLGLAIFAAGSPSSRPTTCGPSDYDAVEQTVTAGSSYLTFDPVTELYTYIWKTDKSWRGCRALLLTFRDGHTGVAWFEFRR